VTQVTLTDRDWSLNPVAAFAYTPPHCNRVAMWWKVGHPASSERIEERRPRSLSDHRQNVALDTGLVRAVELCQMSTALGFGANITAVEWSGVSCRRWTWPVGAVIMPRHPFADGIRCIMKAFAAAAGCPGVQRTD